MVFSPTTGFEKIIHFVWIIQEKYHYLIRSYTKFYNCKIEYMKIDFTKCFENIKSKYRVIVLFDG